MSYSSKNQLPKLPSLTKKISKAKSSLTKSRSLSRQLISLRIIRWMKKS